MLLKEPIAYSWRVYCPSAC